MKHIVLFLSTFFLLFITLSFPVYADYVDDFRTISPSEGIGYYNLTPNLGQPQDGALPLKNYAMIVNPTLRRGGAVYYGTGISEITVGIYSQTGTSVSLLSDGSFVLGHPLKNQGISTQIKAMYSPSYNGVYIQNNGKEWLKGKHSDDKGILFLPTKEVPVDRIPYGLYVTVSHDGIHYESLSLSKTKEEYLPEVHMVYETWSAPVVGKHTYVKVEINDTSVMHTIQGETISKTPYTMTMLAQVKLGGYSILFGPPVTVSDKETVTTSPENDNSSVKVPATKAPATQTQKKTIVSGGTKTESKTETKTKQETSNSKTTSTTNTNKFSGVITPVPSKTKSIGTPIAKKETKTVTDNVENTTDKRPDEISEETMSMRFEEPVARTKNNVSKGINIYIIGVTGVLIYVLIAPKKNKIKSKEEKI